MLFGCDGIVTKPSEMICQGVLADRPILLKIKFCRFLSADFSTDSTNEAYGWGGPLGAGAAFGFICGGLPPGNGGLPPG